MKMQFYQMLRGNKDYLRRKQIKQPSFCLFLISYYTIVIQPAHERGILMKAVRRITGLIMAFAIGLANIIPSHATEYDIDTGGIEETADYQETYAESNGDIIAYSQDEPYLEYVKTIEGHGYTATSNQHEGDIDRYWSTEKGSNPSINHLINTGQQSDGFGGRNMEYVPLLENVYLPRGSIISITITGAGCSHIGAQSSIYISNATSYPVPYNHANQIQNPIMRFNLTGTGVSSTAGDLSMTQHYRVDTEGYYTVDGYGAAYYCVRNSRPGLYIESQYGIYRYRFPITYDLEGITDSHGTVCLLPAPVTDPGNPTYYYEATPTFTLEAPEKRGHTFTGWTGSCGDVPTVEVTIPQWSSGARHYTANWEVNQYPVEYVDVIDPAFTNGETRELGRSTEMRYYGTEIRGEEKGNITYSGYYYRHYSYSHDDGIKLVDIDNNVVYRFFQPTPMSFYVSHRLAYFDPSNGRVYYNELQRLGPFGRENPVICFYGDSVLVDPSKNPFALSPDKLSLVDGYSFPEPKSVSIDKDMQIVFFDYDIIPAAVEVIDRDRETGATLNAERHYIENCMPGETIYGSHYDKTDGGNPYEADGYIPAGSTSVMVTAGSTGQKVYRDFVKNGVTYKVYHHREVLEGGNTYEGQQGKYDEGVVETLGAVRGTEVTPAVKTPKDDGFAGYITPDLKHVMVGNDNTTEIHYFYRLNTYRVIYKDVVKDTMQELGSSEQGKRYGDAVSGADLGTDKSFGKYYKNYVYDSCTEAVVDGNDVTVYRYFVLKVAPYTVYHELEQPDGSYVCDRTVSGEDEIGKTVYPQVIRYEGYVVPETRSLVVSGDGTAELTYRYALGEYDVAFIDMVKDKGAELGRSTEKRKYATIVSGSEKGTSTEIGAYYEGYSYNSCTSATVGVSGTAVYRYFTKDTTTYKVIHQLEREDGSYETADERTYGAKVGETVYPQPEGGYEGYEIPPVQSAVVREDGSTTITYRYRLNRYDVTYIDMVKDTQEELGRTVEKMPYGKTVSGADRGTSTVTGIYYGGYVYDSCTTATVGLSGVTVYRYFRSDTVYYTVNHEQQQVDGTYKCIESIRHKGHAGDTVTPEPKSYTGFTKPGVQSATVKADGTTVVTYRYDRKKFPVRYVDIDRDTDKELGSRTQDGIFGAQVSGSDIGSDTKPDAYYKGFTYSSCTDAVVGVSGTVVYRYFITEGTRYTVIHQQEQPDGSWKTVETETLSEKAGREVSPPTKNYKGFTSPEPQTLTVKADGTSSLTYRYSRNEYYVTYADKVKETSATLGQSMEKKPFGTAVSGADRGTSMEPGAYYEGYMYDSCTDAVVDTYGTIVYRYFVSSMSEYTVIHQQEQPDGSWITVQTERIPGEAGTTVTPVPKDYEGFTSPEAQTTTINPDGSSSVTYRYTRNRYSVSYVDMVKGTTVILGKNVEEKPYGTRIAGSDMGSSRETGAYYESYAYDSCTSDTVKTSGSTVYRYFVSKISGVVIYHQQEQLDGTFLTVDIETLKASAGEKITPPVKSYDGFVSPSVREVTVLEDGSTNVVYKYMRKDCGVVYVDRIKGTQTELGRTDGSVKFGQTVHGSDIGDSKTVGAYYEGYVYVSCTSAVAGTEKTVVYRDFSSNAATYTVTYQQEQPDGTYRTVETETLGGEAGTEVTPPAKDYEGFVTPPAQTITIKPDGSANVTYKYERKEYTVTYMDVIRDSMDELGKKAVEKPYGSSVSGADLGSDRETGRYYDGYSYDGCTSETVGTSGAVVYRFFVMKECRYRVHHYQEQVSGEYTLVETNDRRGEAGTRVTPPVNTYVGFTSPDTQTATINPDGTTEVVYNYRRNSYPVVYVDIARDTKEELGRLDTTRKYGDIVSGSDIGSTADEGAYYEGYAYNSCTTEIVDVNDTVVYRYFIRKNHGTGEPEKAEYRVFHKQEQPDGSYITVEMEVLTGTAGKKVTPAVRKYDGYVSPPAQTVEVAADGTTEVVYMYRISVKNSDYRVFHQQQQLDGTYKTVETETFSAPFGTETTPSVKTYDGFVSPEPQTVTVGQDNCTVVVYKYDRLAYSVTYIDAVKDTGHELGRATEGKPYGSFISGSDRGDDKTPGAYYAGFAYDSCTSVTVEKPGTTVYRYFVESVKPDEPGRPDMAEYKVFHQLEQPDGSYITVDIETFTGKPGEETTPPVRTYENYTSPAGQTVVVTEDGAAVVVYQYALNSYDVIYIDKAEDTGKQLGKTTESRKYGTTVSGSDRGDDRTPGAYYKGYTYGSCTSAVVGSSGATVYRYFLPEKDTDGPEKTEYRVIYQEEKPDGTYETVEVKVLEGAPGEEVTPVPADRDGFVTPPPQTVTVNKDGSTTVTYKYERKSHEVTFIDLVKGTKDELGRKTEMIKSGVTVSGGDMGTDKTMDAYYKGFSYDSCTSAVVDGEGTVVYRYFVPKQEPEDPKPEKADVTVIYQEEQIDGTYITVKKDVIEGNTGEKVTVTPEPKEGFETPRAQTVTVNKDGTASITCKYKRKSYPVSYVDMTKDGKTELGRTVKNRKFESSVSGSEMGTDRTLGLYYKGYVYDSCTSASVTTSGATVYRYFVEKDDSDGDKKPDRADYTVIIEEEQPDGSYITVEVRKESGTVGDRVSPKPDAKDGFVTPPVKTITIKADGTASVTYRYERASYDVKYIDIVKGTKKELGKTSLTKKWGTVAMGSDIGDSKAADAYYKGYVYDSCTSEIVGKSGTKVYRYFTKVVKTDLPADNGNSNNGGDTRPSGTTNKPDTSGSGTGTGAGSNVAAGTSRPTTNTTQKPDKDYGTGNIVKTGENTYAGIFVAAVLLAVAGYFVISRKRK